jgi:hypothetical protein
MGIKGEGLNGYNISDHCARRRRRDILFCGGLIAAAPPRPIMNLSGHCEFIVNGSAVGAKITATKHNFVPGWATISGE